MIMLQSCSTWARVYSHMSPAKTDYHIYMKRIFLFMLSLAAVASCGNNGEYTEQQQLFFSGDTVRVNAASPILSHIKTSEVAPVPFSSEFRTVGTARAENGSYAEVVIPFDGRITRSFVRIGQKVRPGQALFELYSPEFNELVKEYFQAQRTADKVKADYMRKQSLYENEVISKREIEESFTEMEIAQRDLESAEATLKIYNVDFSKVRVGQPVSILAPISGEVVAADLTVGQYVKADDESPVIIADLGNMWVTALVKEHFIGSVSNDAEAEVFIESIPDTPVKAKVLNVGNVVDEETRAVQVILSCDNSERMLKHGMYVSVHFMSEPKDMIVVPSSAIFQGEQFNYVFVQSSVDTFLKRRVVLGSGNDDKSLISIKSGLAAGEKVITEGGIYLSE